MTVELQLRLYIWALAFVHPGCAVSFLELTLIHTHGSVVCRTSSSEGRQSEKDSRPRRWRLATRSALTGVCLYMTCCKRMVVMHFV